MHLFTYGTLMFPAVWQAVVGREFCTRPATINGFQVRRARGELFPVMFSSGCADVVRGVVYLDLDAAARALLDDFESTLYERVAVKALVGGVCELACQAYVLPERNRRFASAEPWTAEWFEREALAEYLRRVGA